jgi:hypothetical protein
MADWRLDWQLDGTGNVWRDGQIIISSVQYSVQKGRETSEGPGHLRGPSVVHGPTMLRGRIFVGLAESSYVNIDVELELETGDRWPCRIVTADGELVSRGKILRQKNGPSA